MVRALAVNASEILASVLFVAVALGSALLGGNLGYGGYHRLTRAVARGRR